jgi:PAS domain S-box-containing protein
LNDGPRLLRTLIDAIPDLVWLKDAEGVYLDCNARFERFFGASKGAILGKTDYDFVSRELADFFREHDRLAMSAGHPTVNEEEITFADDGHHEFIETIKTPILGPDGKPVGVLGIGRDITERKGVADRLRVSEQKFHQAFHTAPLLASLSRLHDGMIIDVNERYCQILGFDREEVLGRTSVDLGIFSPGERARLLGHLGATRSVQNLEIMAQDKSGRSIPCLFSAEVITVGEETLLLVMALDLRERKTAEQLQRSLDAELYQVQKMDSLGSLAGGVAHDMNNVLAAIQAVTETLRASHAADPDLTKSLGIIEKAATRGRDLVKGLTHFARKELREPEILDLNSLVREEMDLLSRTTLQKVNLVMELEDPLGAVLGERSMLASALMNLCVNAVDAMPGGGALTLRTQNRPDGQVTLSVVDSGEGMPPGVVTRAMEPFFTTKPMGKGTGLGLSMAYTIAKTHGGNLTIQSEPGLGTTVTLWLPAAGALGRPGSPAEPEPPLPDAWKILLVDDDELILAAMPALIEAQGHRVTTARGGPEALALLASGAQVDLVVLDLNMPGMNGTETLRNLREIRPDLPVILATGFLDDRTRDLLAAEGKVWSLFKPYAMAQLLQKIREIAARLDG